ncbi:MAG: glycosyltransferase family 4 protein [Candidatus Eisenbacteria bacterium]
MAFQRRHGLCMVPHPSLTLDELAGPWIHLAGTEGAIRSLGYRVVLARYGVLERLLQCERLLVIGPAARVASELLLPWVVAASCLRTDLVPYIRHYHDMTPAYFLLRLVRRPFVVEVNATLYEEPHRFSRSPAWLLRLARRLETTALKKADVLIAVSGVLRERMLERGFDPSRVVAVHNGIECDVHDVPAVDQETSGIVYVGHFKSWHRVELLLDAYGEIAEWTDERLLLVGEGDSEALRTRATSLGVADRIAFLGRRSRGEVGELMRRARVLVLPNTADYGSPLKLFEYLASGRPAVLPDLPNIREVVVDREHAFLFAPGDRHALASCINRLIADPAEGDEVGRRGRELVCREYTWRASAARTIHGISEHIPLTPENSDQAEEMPCRSTSS